MHSSENNSMSTFYKASLPPGDIDRLVLRMQDAKVLVQMTKDNGIYLEACLDGSGTLLHQWQPEVRRSVGILVIADPEDPNIKCTTLRIRLPIAVKDLEIHTNKGGIELDNITTPTWLYTLSGSISSYGSEELVVSTESGTVDIKNSRNVQASASTGTLAFKDISGTLTAHNKSGEIKVENIQGFCSIISEQGDISLILPKTRFNIGGGTGFIEVELDNFNQASLIESLSGDVNLVLTNCNLQLRAESLSGKIEVPFSRKRIEDGKRRCVRKIGTGMRKLYVKTISGSIKIDIDEE